MTILLLVVLIMELVKQYTYKIQMTMEVEVYVDTHGNFWKGKTKK